jgi:hypothetical protein
VDSSAGSLVIHRILSKLDCKFQKLTNSVSIPSFRIFLLNYQMVVSLTAARKFMLKKDS